MAIAITENTTFMYDRRFTPERISELRENEIFVFGSNLAGAHGGGAARLAYNRFGAVWGEGVGLHGQTYAIPTMQGGVETIKLRCLRRSNKPKSVIRISLCRTAKRNPLIFPI